MEKDHRIKLSEERFKSEKRTHVYLYLSEQKLPYVVSLGWFVSKQETIAPPPEKSKSVIPGLGGKKKKKPEKGISETASQTQDLLNPGQKNQLLIAIDELGLTLPNPNFPPREKNYDKADWSAVQGFDNVTDNDLNGAKKEFAEATKLVPVNARFNNNLGAILAAQGDFAEAAKYFDRAIRENDSFAAAYTNRALLSLAVGKPEEAMENATVALKLHPTLMPARVAYGRALMEKGDDADALKVAEILKSEAQTEWQALLLLADAQLANKQFKESKITLARLGVLNPGNAEIVIKLAHANDKLGDLDEAIKLAKKSTQLAPDDPRTHITLARYLDADRDANAARLQYERALDCKPDKNLRKTAMAAILRMLIATDKMPQADEFSKKWLKQYPDDATCYYNRAWIASQLAGEHAQECIEDYRKALELEPTLSSIRYNLALVLLKAGKNTDALHELKEFVKALPEDSDSQSARDLIKKLEGGS
jgi:tetratricopeptide (TPR) repeat protein